MTEKKEMQEKPLDKMTVTELREVAKELPDITGVHGMKKAELLAAIKEAKGIADEPEKAPAPAKKAPAKKAPAKGKKVLTVQEMKALIKELKAQRTHALAEKDSKMAKVYKRRISRLKKKTRQAA